jgi:hypothetical protein
MTKEARAKLDAVLCGVAGEYFVAAELSRLGYIASLTLRNTRGVDILVSNRDATKSVGIQVKTNQRGIAGWILTEKIERDAAPEELAENLYFVFVALPPAGSPRFHVISRRDVSRIVRQGHQDWIAAPGRQGQQHRPSAIRKFTDHEGKYLNNWSILGLD